MEQLTEREMKRYWKSVLQGDTCWLWSGDKNRKGYARFRVVRNGRRFALRAYCIAWEKQNGCEWPVGAMACHSCDNPACVNPTHVRPGTAADNAADAIRRGRDRGISSVNRAKTECVHGHALDGDNLYVDRNGFRRCVTCQRAGARAFARRVAMMPREAV